MIGIRGCFSFVGSWKNDIFYIGRGKKKPCHFSVYYRQDECLHFFKFLTNQIFLYYILFQFRKKIEIFIYWLGKAVYGGKQTLAKFAPFAIKTIVKTVTNRKRVPTRSKIIKKQCNIPSSCVRYFRPLNSTGLYSSYVWGSYFISYYHYSRTTECESSQPNDPHIIICVL